MRRSGSAAPHSNWSPQVKAARYPGPSPSCRAADRNGQRAGDGAGVSSRSLISRSFGTTLAHGLAFASMSLISSSGTSFFSLMVSACEWQRMAPIRTHRPSIGIEPGVRNAGRPRILLHRRRPSTLPSTGRPRPERRSTGSASRRAGVAEVLLREAVRTDGFGDLAVDVEMAEPDRPAGRQPRRGWCPSARSARACSARPRPRPPDRSSRSPIRSGRSGTGRRGPSASAKRCSCRRSSSCHPWRARSLITFMLTGSRDDHGVVGHAQRRGGVDPVAVPAGSTQLGGRLPWCSRRPGR